MPDSSLIVIGTVGSGLEIVEAAELLGFKVISYNPNSPQDSEIDLSSTPAEHFALPAILGSFPFAVNDELRFDYRTIENRRLLMAVAEKAGFWNWTSIVHPSAVISASTTIGTNVFVNANVTIAFHSTIGDNVFINRNASVGHDVTIGEFCRVGPGTVIPGHVILKDGVTTGPGVVMINNLIIGRNVGIAAGSVVTKDIADGLLVFGSPASAQRPMRLRAKKALKKGLKKFFRKIGLLDRVKTLKNRIWPTRPYV